MGVGYLVGSWRWTSETGVTPDSVPVADRRPRDASTLDSVPRRLIVVAGPTGTGKSELALDLAERLDGEIVNADSMQLYRGMDIGTAKLPPDERRGIPHHLLDVLDVAETATVASYQRDARAAVEDIRAAAGRRSWSAGPVCTSSRVIDDIDFPATDPAVRGTAGGGTGSGRRRALFRLLLERDPAAAVAIGPANGRKIVRALEVIELTGRPFTATLPRWGSPRYDAVLLRLDRPTEQLDQPSGGSGPGDGARPGSWTRSGALDGPACAAGSPRPGPSGTPSCWPCWTASATSSRPSSTTAAATRRFVRRQRSWFRRDQRMIDLDATEPDLLGATLGRSPVPRS